MKIAHSQTASTTSPNHRPRVFQLAVLALSTLPTFPVPAIAADEHYLVGASRIDITPDYPIRLNGFGFRRDESEGVSQRIYARGLAIRTPQTNGANSVPMVLVTVDSTGFRQTLVDEVARRLMQSHRIPTANIVVTFTHSHCTPKLIGAADNIFSQAIPEDHQRHIDRYTRELIDRVTTAARRALDSMRPARLWWTTGKATFAVNRRTGGEPIDHDLPILVARDAETSKPLAIYVSYACHAVTLSFNQISGDWPGYAAEHIERQWPKSVALVSIGAGSDQNPNSGVTGDKTDVAEAQGLEIASEVTRVLKTPMRPIRGTPRAVKKHLKLALNAPPTREQLEKTAAAGDYHAQTMLSQLNAGKAPMREVDYPIQTWSFGDTFCIAFLAGEVCVDYSLRFKRAFDRERFWLNAYSNDFCCYIPSERLVREGGYGGGTAMRYFAVPSTLKAGLEQQIADEVQRQVPPAFHVPAGTQGVRPKTPHESLECLRTAAGFEVVLAAAEPEVTDPVAIDFGPDGRLWVAEMNDYGHDVYAKFRENGRVRWLRDGNGDGRFESAQTFVDELRFPTDIKVWRDGILICDAPNILFARDTNDDGKADDVAVLFSGFEVRNAQARVNSLRFGLDNLIYGASGLFGGSIRTERTGQIVNCANRDFRIDPRQWSIEPVSGRTQQGRCRNDFGDWFGCSNGNLISAIPADDRYLERNQFAPPTRPTRMVIDPQALRLFPPPDLVRFELSGAPGRPTSACGIGIYRDTALGEAYWNDAFTCEPVHQCVHRIDFERRDTVMHGKRGAGEEATEFLSSTDQWFRPVQVRTGPDGSLWVVDMYRYVIEHSRWIPQSTLSELNVFAGQGRGRIYRVLPKSDVISPVIPDLSRLSDVQLARHLQSSNGVVRDLAHQLLLWRHRGNDRRDEAVGEKTIAALQDVARTAAPVSAIHALSVLDGLGSLSTDDVLLGLRIDNTDVRRFSLRLSERFLEDSAAVRASVMELATSGQTSLRRQAALSLGATSNGDVAKAIARLVSTAEKDASVRAAALNAVSAGNVQSVLRELAAFDRQQRHPAAWRKVITLSLQLGDTATIQDTLTNHLPGQTDSLSKADLDLWVRAVEILDAQDHRSVSDNAIAKTRSLYSAAIAALEADVPNSDQIHAALRLLGRRFGSFSTAAIGDDRRLAADRRSATMARFVSPRFPAALQREAIASLLATGAATSPGLLMDRFASLSHELRAAAIDALLSHPNGPAQLARAVTERRIRDSDFSASQRSKLLSAEDAEVRQTAERAFGSESKSPRAEVIRSLEGILDMPGQAELGRVAFRNKCANCHRMENQGHVVGPNLAALTVRDSRWLLNAILDPNRDVDGRYLSWRAIMADGRSFNGMIVEETAAAIRLREAGGKEHVVNRHEIEEFRSSQKSLMPEGLERDLTPQGLRDVIAYLQSTVAPPKTFAGNKPTLVRLDSRRSLPLTAAVAEIRGTHIRFEAPFSNVGYWHHQTDAVTWRVELEKSQQFDVYLDYSCDAPAAGNTFAIEGTQSAVSGTVKSTGGWDQYRQIKIATTRVAAGQQVITVHATAPVQGALFDLREIRFVPVGASPEFKAARPSTSPSLPRHAPEIARFLLTDSESVERRQRAIDQRPGLGPAIISQLITDLPKETSDEEYRRIPWIWRVAIAVAKRNDGGEIRDVLELSVPQQNEPLRDWQAVVIGGGLINGLTQVGVWPDKRLAEILDGLPMVKARWPMLLEQAAAMADNKNVRSGTRYDALRMVALRGEAVAVRHLLRYIKDVPGELQMGAVSGLADIDSSAATDALAAALLHLSGRNRELALEAMLRTAQRATVLEALLRTGKVQLTAAEIDRLRKHALQNIRERAEGVLR